MINCNEHFSKRFSRCAKELLKLERKYSVTILNFPAQKNIINMRCYVNLLENWQIVDNFNPLKKIFLFHKSNSNMMDFTLNRALSKKVVRDS
jgi:hypothetical protein